MSNLIKNGRYSMQVSSPQGALRFDIEVNGNTLATSVKKDGFAGAKTGDDIIDPFAMFAAVTAHFDEIISKLKEAEGLSAASEAEEN